MYKKLIAASTLLILIGAPGVVAQDKEIGTFQFEAKRGAHMARLVLQTAPFDPTKHKVVTDRGNHTIIDGRRAFGTDGNIPRVEIASMRLYINGEEIPVPRRLYADCFEPNPVLPFITVKFGRSPRSVEVVMHGSDAAASYEVVWRLRKGGRHSRSIHPTFPE